MKVWQRKIKLWQIFYQKLLASKTLVNSYLFAFFMYIMRHCMDGKICEPPVIRQICPGFPPPKIRVIQCISHIYHSNKQLT